MAKTNFKPANELKVIATQEAEQHNVSPAQFMVLKVMLCIIIGIDASFFFHTFQPLFQNDYAEYLSSADFINNLIKSLLPLGLIVPLKLFLAKISLSHEKYSITKPKPINSTVELTLKSVLWAIMIAGVILSIYMQITAGHITFIIAALKYAVATPTDIEMGIASVTATNSSVLTGASQYVDDMYLLFLSTSLAAALCWQEHNDLQAQQKYSYYMGTVTEKCERFLRLEEETAVIQSVLKYISDDLFLHETVSTAHSNLHDSVLTSLQRAKGFVEKCTDLDSAPEKVSQKVDKVHVSNGIYVKGRDELLKKISEAIKKLEKLKFYLPNIMMDQASIKSNLSQKENNNG